LSHLGRLEILAALFQEVVVPAAVVAELEQPRPRFAPVTVRGLPFVCIRSPQDRAAVDELRETLGPGEAEAIILAEELHAEAILIDEAAGRAVALQRGLRPIGVLGTLLRAKERGLIREISPLLDRLQKELGFFISSKLRDDTLKQAGEAE
jgi:predicted nucleic acid-binding protein